MSGKGKADLKQKNKDGGSTIKHYHYEKENSNHGAACRYVCSCQFELCAATAFETATSPTGCTRTLIDLGV